MTQPTDTATPPEPVVVEELTPVEAAFYTLVLAGLSAWLSDVSARVLFPWNLYRMAPNPAALWSLVPQWNATVRTWGDWLRGNAAPEGWGRWFRERGGDLDPPFPSTDAFVASHIAQVENYLVRIPEEVFSLVMADVVDGHNAGESFEEIAARIEDTLNLTGSENWPARARVIAVTETNGTASAGWLAAAIRTEELLGVPQWKKWLQSHDRAVRDAHRIEQKRPVREPFYVGGEYLMVPGAKNGSPENIINCVPGNSRVRASGVRAVFRFQWDGPVFTLTGEGGFRSTVSPYHPVLTERGWVPACQVQKGDYLVTAGDVFLPLDAGPDVESMPPEIEEVFDSLALTRNRHRVPGLLVDFHGDRPCGNVDVVFSDGNLSFGLDAHLGENLDQFSLAVPDFPSPPQGAGLQLGLGPRSASDRVVGPSDLGGTGVRGHSGPFHQFRLASAAGGDSEGREPSVDRAPGDPKAAGERENRFSGLIQLTEVLEVDVTEFHGFLYSVETSSGIYIADDIVTHNCRCAPGFTEAPRGN